jgi:CheY-like chemotaxis protein
MLSPDDIKQYQKQLSIYRQNLSYLLTQAAQYGGELSAPVPTLNGIADARDNIQRLKDLLRMNGVRVEDKPDEISLVRQALNQAISKQTLPVSETERSQVLRRVRFAAEVLKGAQVLWVDDHPNNVLDLRQILRTFGVFVDLARSTEEAIELLSETHYDLIISDMVRNGIQDEGLRFLERLKRENLYRPLIFYTLYSPDIWARAQEAFAIIIRPDQLLHSIIDVLERERI